MRFRLKLERAGHIFADEGIVVDFGESLRGRHCAHLALIRTHGVIRRHDRFDQRRLRCDGIVAQHAAHFFQQVVFDGDIFGGAPAWNHDGEVSGSTVSDEEFEGLQDGADLVSSHRAAEFRGYPVY